MTSIKFVKMHGLGNDFILIDAVQQSVPEDLSRMARHLCHRQFGIGADGLILAWPSHTAAIRMQILNADGTEPEMCGNGIRCFARFVRERGLVRGESFTVETLAGTMVPTFKDSEQGLLVEVDMGPPILEPKKIPTTILGEGPVLDYAIELGTNPFNVTPVSMGNPHAVIFVPNLEAIDLAKLGPLCENHVLFPEKINTEFVEILTPYEAKMRVWERGAGATLACGTGACAILVAGVLTKRLKREATIQLPGGNLRISWPSDTSHVFMTGPAETSYQGQLDL